MTENRFPDHLITLLLKSGAKQWAGRDFGNRDGAWGRFPADTNFVSRILPEGPFSSIADSVAGVFWFPRGIPRGQSVCLACSRIGFSPDQKPQIFDAIRTFACRINATERFLITHPGTTLDSWTARAAELFRIPSVSFQPFPARPTHDWIQARISNGGDCHQCFYWTESPASSPDSILIRVADQVRTLFVTRNGNVFNSMVERLKQPHRSGSVWQLVDPDLTDRLTSDVLIQAGASQWLLFHGQNRRPAAGTPGSSHWIPLSDFSSSCELSDFLAHWTRRRRGPWPDQTGDQFLDDLLFGSQSGDHSRIATLCRILASQCILASNKLTRDSTPVVSFTENRVDQLAGLRAFRPHLARWDFETVGIAIRRDRLIEMGARQVIYGDDDVWESLPLSKRPYFQLQTPDSGIEWTREREWRIGCNVMLQQLGPDEAFIFVGNRDEAAIVSRLSRWPVVVLDE